MATQLLLPSSAVSARWIVVPVFFNETIYCETDLHIEASGSCYNEIGDALLNIYYTYFV
jgi:hypothetical protein